MGIIIDPLTGTTKLRDAWPKINQNFTNIKTEVGAIVVNASIDPEVAVARTSAVKSETFATLGARLEGSEQDLVMYKAETTSELNAKMDKVTTSIMISQIDKNLGKFDQTYMSDELLQQIAGTTPVNAVPSNFGVTSVKLAEKAVTAEKTSFIKRSSNLYNKNTDNIGFSLSSADGSLVSYVSYNTSDYISIKPSTNYYYYGLVSVAYYGENKQFLSRPAVPVTGGSLTSPSNAYYIRTHYQPASAYDPQQINEGSTQVPYEEFYQLLDIDLKDNAIQTNNLSEKSVTESKMGLLSVGEGNLISGAVTAEKTSFILGSSNLFNHETITSGVYISSDGIIMEGANYSISDFINIIPSTNYSSLEFINLAYYDINKNFISRIFLDPSIEQNWISRSDAYFIRMNFQGGLFVVNRQINKSTALLEYELYQQQLTGVGLSPDTMLTIKQDEDIAKLINITDSVMLDVPIDGVFDTNETYPEYTSFTSTTSAQVYQMYDDLMALYPDYITKQVLGTDLFGNTISLYKFIPYKPSASVSTKYPKVFLTSGTHGYEHVPGLITFLMFKDICEKWQGYPLLEALRFNVDFLVIPVVNPSGWDDYTRKNRNGVDINRNFPEGWVLADVSSGTYGGTSPLSELESQYVSSVFDDNTDIDIMYDFHNFSGDVTTDLFIWIPTESEPYVQHMAQTLISRMTRKWRKDYTFLPTGDDYFVGYTDGTYGAMIQDHARGRGIKFCAIFEVCGRWWLEALDQPYNTTHKVTSVEALVNWLLINLKELMR